MRLTRHDRRTYVRYDLAAATLMLAAVCRRGPRRQRRRRVGISRRQQLAADRGTRGADRPTVACLPMAPGLSSTAQNNPAQQTGYFKYDIWDPAAGLNGGHLTLDSARQTDIFCSSQVILPQSGSVFIAGGDNWTGTATTNTGNNNSNIFRPSDNTLYRETTPAAAVPRT